MRYSQLKAFHNVALHGGFSRAAEALFLTQPAISEQVRKLEQDHDILLFFRDRKQVRMTPEGESLFLMTQRFFEVEEQIEGFMSENRAAVTGTLRIFADTAHNVTDILSRFQKRYPKVFVSLRTGNSDHILNELRAYNAEIGVVGGLTPGSDMKTHFLGSTPIIAIAAHGVLAKSKRMFTRADFAAYPLVMREKGSKTGQKIEEEAHRHKIPLTPAIEAEGREAMLEVVAAGSGVGFVSQHDLGHDDRFVSLPIEGFKASMDETLVYLGQRENVRVIRAFMELLTEG